MAELALDVVEQILVRLDVKDLIQYKSVCKSWQSFISSPPFVKAHLNHAYANDRNNPELGYRRICFPEIKAENSWFYFDEIFIVGSSNGLLCVSPKGVKFVVTNPETREYRKLPKPPFRPQMHKIGMIRQVVCWGFGYDSSADDYKVIAGFMKNWHSKRTCFHVLALKSNTWKVIGDIKYSIDVGRSGIFCGGALHWIMTRKKKPKYILISLDLSTEEFEEIPLPDADLLYGCDCSKYNLGVIEECLCIYTRCTKKWVMKNNKWELYTDDHCQSKYDIAHYLRITKESQMKSSDCLDDGIRVPIHGAHIRASLYVKSLVSPYPHDNNNNKYYEEQKRNAKQGHEATKSVESGAKGHIRKRKREKSKRCWYDWMWKT